MDSPQRSKRSNGITPRAPKKKSATKKIFQNKVLKAASILMQQRLETIDINH